MKVQLVALDLDGTLFNTDGQISEENKAAIRKAMNHGVEVVISTGRPYVGLPMEQIRELGLRYAITTNGAAIYEIETGKCIAENCMDPDLISEVIGKIEQLYVYCDIFIEGNGYGRRDKIFMIDDLAMPESIRRYIKSTRQYSDELKSFISETGKGVQKITLDYVMQDDQLIDFEESKKILNAYPQLTVVSGGCNNLEITCAGTTKAKALYELCDYLQIPRENTMGCGDSENDLALIEGAGIGVAMANAENCVKERADFITSSNNEHGVARAIERFCFQDYH